jgi:hypothetical protein
VMLFLAAVRRLTRDHRARGPVAGVLWLAFVVVTVAMAIPRMYTFKKVLEPGWPFLAIGAAWILLALPARWRRVGVVTALAVSMAGAFVNVVIVQKDDWRSVARFVSQQLPAGDALWLDPPEGEIPYRYYLPGSTPASMVPGESLARLLQSGRPVWLIVYHRFGVAGPETPSRTWLDRAARLTRRVEFAGLELLRYEDGAPK